MKHIDADRLVYLVTEDVALYDTLLKEFPEGLSDAQVHIERSDYPTHYLFDALEYGKLVPFLTHSHSYALFGGKRARNELMHPLLIVLPTPSTKR